jgi:hypothetical protein
MLRHIAEPADTGRLEAYIKVEAASHGPVDDDLFLLVQQFDQPPLSTDEAVDAVVGVDEEGDNLVLLVRRRPPNCYVANCICI